MMVADFQSCTRRIGTSQRLNSCILLHIFSIGQPRHLTLYFRTFQATFYRHNCKLLQDSNSDCQSRRISQRTLTIGRFIAIWATFQSLCQQLICPNLLYLRAIFLNESKSLIFQMKSSLGNFYKHLATFFWSHSTAIMIRKW